MYRHVCVHIHMYAHMHVLNVHTPMHAQGKVLQSNKLGIKKNRTKKNKYNILLRASKATQENFR